MCVCASATVCFCDLLEYYIHIIKCMYIKVGFLENYNFNRTCAVDF